MECLNQNGRARDYVLECGSNSSMVDEKKRKRMISNRESARRCRKKKQEQMQNLCDEVIMLQGAINGTMEKIDGISKKYVILATENSVLRAQEKELSERLKALNEVIEGSGLGEDDDDDAQVRDAMLEPWQLPFPILPINASSSFDS